MGGGGAFGAAATQKHKRSAFIMTGYRHMGGHGHRTWVVFYSALSSLGWVNAGFIRAGMQTAGGRRLQPPASLIAQVSPEKQGGLPLIVLFIIHHSYFSGVETSLEPCDYAALVSSW